MPRSTLPSTLRAVAAVLTLTAGLALPALALAVPASAHARLVSSDPTDGAHLAAPPTKVTLTFDEAVADGATIGVSTADGRDVARGTTTVAGAVVSRAVSGPRDAGYTVTYRVMSDDGHPVAGTLTFSTGSVTSVGGSSHGDGATRAVLVAAVLVVLAGLGVLTVRRWAPDLWRSR